LPAEHRIWSALLSFALLQGLTLAIVLALRPAGRRRPRLYLAAALGGNAIVLCFWLLFAADAFRAFPLSHALARFFTWSLAPLLYFYIRTLLDDEARPSLWLVATLVLLPGLIRLGRDLWHGYDLQMIAHYLDLAREEGALPGAKAGTTVTILRTAYQLVFAVLSFGLLYRAWNSMRDGQRSFPRGQLVWLGSLAALIVAFNVAHVQASFASLSTHWLPLSSAYATSLVRAGIVQLVAFVALLTPESVDQLAGNLARSPRRAPLDARMARQTLERLREEMSVSAAYRDPTLRVSKLALSTGVPQHLVSRVLNEELKLSFPDFVNGYRVNEARRLLRSERARQITLSAIGEEAGFASRTSFHRVFKSVTGLTPSDYRDASDADLAEPQPAPPPPIDSTPRAVYPS